MTKLDIQQGSREWNKGWRAGNSSMKRMLNSGSGLFDPRKRAKAYARAQGDITLQQFIDTESGYQAGARAAWSADHRAVSKLPGDRP